MKGFSLTGLCPFYLSVFRIGLPLTFPFIIDPEVIEGVPKQFFAKSPAPSSALSGKESKHNR